MNNFPKLLIDSNVVIVGFGLKAVNDSFGMRAGDMMLIDTSRIFARVFRQEDIVTRFGGDEFAVLLPSCDENAVKAVLDRLEYELGEFNKTHENLPIRISLGISTAKKGESLKAHQKLAEKQMRAKAKRSQQL